MQEQIRASLPEGGKARRVYLLLRDQIMGGAHPQSAFLPAEQRLAEMFDVSRVTIRRALQALVADGLIEKRAGAGAVVRPRSEVPEPIAANLATLIPQLVDIDEATTARLLSFSYEPAPDMVAHAMGCANGTTVQKAVRVRSINAQPYSYLTTYVPEQVARNYSESDLATAPMFRLLERSGALVDEAKQSISATLAPPDVAEVLDISVGSALLSIKRVVRDQNGRSVEYLDALYRPDVFRLEMTLNRVGEGGARHWEPVIGDDSAMPEAAE